MVNNKENFSSNVTLFEEKTGEKFTEFWTMYQPKLVNYINNICMDRQIAEDITTDSFLQALSKINMYDKDKSNFSTWLFVIAKNIALQEIRRNKTISIDADISADGLTLKDFIKLTDDNNNDMNTIIEKSNIMKKRIKELKNPYKQVLIMRELDKMSYKDIAKSLNRNLSTVKSQIRNGRKLLIKQTKTDFAKIEID